MKLRGAPYAATPEKIIEFFGDISQTIATRGVHQVLNSGVSKLIRDKNKGLLRHWASLVLGVRARAKALSFISLGG